MSKSKIENIQPIGQLTKDEKKFVKDLANLIEIGCEGMLQQTGGYLSLDGKRCCAMGAAFKGAGDIAERPDGVWVVVDGSYSLLKKLNASSWPRIPFPKSHQVEEQPFATNNLNTSPVIDVVIFLNDRLGWSFDKIVNYLRDCTLKQPKTIAIKP